jgi:hypothetical protein
MAAPNTLMLGCSTVGFVEINAASFADHLLETDLFWLGRIMQGTRVGQQGDDCSGFVFGFVFN